MGESIPLKMRQESTKAEYISRINRVLDFIDNNIEKNFSLKELSLIALFSQYHFHRIFKAMVGETLNQYINRVRVEKAAGMLVAYPGKTVTEIAFDCGFSGSSAFARAFKDYFGMSATRWRSGGCREYSKNRKIESNPDQTKSNYLQSPGKIRKDFESSKYYVSTEFNNMSNDFKWRIAMDDQKLTANVEVKEVPDMLLAYVRHIGPYAGDENLFKNLFDKIFKWAGPRGLINFPKTKTITVYHDNPEITDQDKLRISCGITVPESTNTDGEIGLLPIPGGKYAIAHFEIFPDQYGEAWNALYGGWLPESGYQPDDRPCFEVYGGDPNEHPEGKHIVDIYAGVKPL